MKIIFLDEEFGICGNLACRDVYPWNGRNYCKACHAKYMRENRKKYSELSPEQRKKANARSIAGVYYRRGLIERKPCKRCGSNNSEKHHEDYNKSLSVEWYCRKCHLDLHQEKNDEKMGQIYQKFKNKLGL